MKKTAQILLLSLVASMSLMFGSCKDPNPEPEQISIIGSWVMDKAIQIAEGNEVDLTNMYGEGFTLTFQENGVLITTNSLSTAEMQWTLDGDLLAFIQTPGAPAVNYIVRELTEENLTIENGTGTDYVTTMYFHRVQ